MPNQISTKIFIGNVAMMKKSDGTFSHGHLHQISNNCLDKISYEITSLPISIFFWGKGDSLRETINNFLSQCDENERIPFIEPAIFNFMIEHEFSSDVQN